MIKIETKKLGDVIKMHYGKALKRHDRKKGDIPVYGSNGVVGYHNEHLTSEPTIIIGRKGSVGEINLSLSSSWTIDTAYYVEIIDEKKLDLKYLYYFAKILDVSDITQKGVKPGINRNDYLAKKIPLLSIEEQKRIVKKLDDFFEKYEQAKEKLEESRFKTKELFDSYLVDKLKNVSTNWISMDLIEGCEKITDGSHFSPKSNENGSFPYITVRDIDNDIIDFNNCKFVSKKDFELLKKNGCSPLNGDLLYSKDGTVGKVSLVDYNRDFVVLSSLAIIRPKKKLLRSELLKYILKNPDFFRMAVGKKTGAAIKRIILRNLKAIKINFPKSLKEQSKLIKNINQVFEKARNLQGGFEKQLKDLEELKKSVINSAFTGNL